MRSTKRKAAIDENTSPSRKSVKHRASTGTFLNLPNELIGLICEYLPTADLSHLCLVNKHFLAGFEPSLYNRDVVNAYSESLLWSAIHNRPATARKAIFAGAKIDGWKAKPDHDGADRGYVETAKRETKYGNRARVPLSHCDQSPLFIAAYQGHLEIVEMLLSSGATPNWKTPWENYMTAASAAAAKGHSKVLEHMYKTGCDLVGDRCYHGTVLHSAVHHGRVKVVEFLVGTVGLEIGEKNENGQTALVMAISCQSITILRYLLKLTPPKDVSVAAALSEAIERYRPGYAEIILDSNKIDWSYKTRFSDTLIMQTIQEDKPYFLQLLLERGGFDPNAPGHGGLTPLKQAANIHGYQGKLPETLLKSDKILLADKLAIGESIYFGNLHRANCDTLLELVLKEGFAGNNHVAHFHGAAAHGRVGLVRLLVEEFVVPVDSKLPTGCTALQDAVMRQDVETTKCLCLLGASTILGGLDEMPMLHHATRHAPLPLVRALLDGGADPSQTAKGSKQTALHVACAMGNMDKVTTLFKYGTDPMLCDADGLTAFHFAARTGKEKLVKWLLSGRRHPDPLLQDGPTLLHEACRGGNTPVVKFLLKRKSNIEARTSRGETALHIAVAGNHLEIIRLLLSNSADVLAEATGGSTPVSLAAKSDNMEVRDALQHEAEGPKASAPTNQVEKSGADQSLTVRAKRGGGKRPLRRSGRGTDA